MKYLIITAFMLFLSMDLFAQKKVMQSDLSRLEGDKYVMNIGLFTRARNVSPFREDTLYIMVEVEAQKNIVSEDVLNLYVSRIINEFSRNAMAVLKKSLIFYQYALIDKNKATHFLKIKVEPQRIECKIQEKGGQEIPIEGPADLHNMYFIDLKD